MEHYLVEENKKYLKLLAKRYPSIQAASTEIINLKAILSLPKGTEHFLSDLHGENEAFTHMLKNGSGIIAKKIEDVFQESLSVQEKGSLAQLIYYPKEMMDLWNESASKEWCTLTIARLIKVCRVVASKYTHSKIRKALAKDFSYIIEELLHEQEDNLDKHDYYLEMIQTIIETEQTTAFIIHLCELIQRLSVDHLHIIGDIYDRGPGADIIMDALANYHSLDIQWGNHDIGWLGAASGSEICIANTIRLTVKSGNLHTLEEGYGINLLPLAKFAMSTYPVVHPIFKPSAHSGAANVEDFMCAQIHKAIAIIQFKLEGQWVERHPEYNLEDRVLLSNIDFEKGTVAIKEDVYALRDNDFPTVNPYDPFQLTPAEKDVVMQLKSTFLRNEKLKKHAELLLAKGGMYLTYNGNLLFHGCIPMTEDKEFDTFEINGIPYKGKALLDQLDALVRTAFVNRHHEKDPSNSDLFWYLATGEKSSLFGKKKMTTFERYFIIDSKTHHEGKNAYYQWILEKDTCVKILEEFGLKEDTAKIINGHVPVKVSRGESPLKAEGKLLVIDGGLSKAYQSVTGIAGYTLLFNSYGMILAAHEPFRSKQAAIHDNADIRSNLTVLDNRRHRIKVADTDIGMDLKKDIKDLELLLYAYKKGLLV
ncbi:MAG: fructose-1,6-bisphosphatase [Vallitaleaceae bacterium]|nr:fructose-1,6-bisphosphatase [Vallitaleaceae bacterium]